MIVTECKITLESHTDHTCTIIFDKETNWLDVIMFVHEWKEEGWCFDWEFDRFIEYVRHCFLALQYGYDPVVVRVVE